MSQPGHETVTRRRPAVQAFLLRESISWAGGLLALTGLAGLASAVIQPINQLTKPFADDLLVNGPGGSPAEFTGQVELPVGLKLLSETQHVVFGLAVCLGAWMLRKVLLSIGAGAPFDERNPGRLRYLALALLLASIVAPVVTYWSTRAILAYADADPLSSYLPNDVVGSGWFAVWGALVILAFAEAFRQGRLLAEDSDGLV